MVQRSPQFFPLINSNYHSPVLWHCKLYDLITDIRTVSHNACRRFDALLKTYEQLAEMVLFTFRTDIRCQAIHYLSLSIRRASDEELFACQIQ